MNTDTKRHIDAARQVLVGVVPNPTSQIDQKVMEKNIKKN